MPTSVNYPRGIHWPVWATVVLTATLAISQDSDGTRQTELNFPRTQPTRPAEASVAFPKVPPEPTATEPLPPGPQPPARAPRAMATANQQTANQQTANQQTANQQTANQQTASPQGESSTSQAGGGFDRALVSRGSAAFQSACTQCHDAERSTTKSKDLAGWRATVRRMAGKTGADIPQSDWEAIATYLASLSAPAGGGGGGAAAATAAAPEQQFSWWAVLSP